MFRCLWVEDKQAEMTEIESRLETEDPDWAIFLCSGRDAMLNSDEVSNRDWDMVVLDGRMQAEFNQREEDAGRNIFVDLRAGRFGEWGRNVTVILYSGIADVLMHAKEWPSPAPIVLSKNESLDHTVTAFRGVKDGIQKSQINGLTPPTYNIVVHYGAGRIGFSVALPLVADAKHCSLILVNRFKGGNNNLVRAQALAAVADSRQLEVLVAGIAYHFDVWHDGLPKEHLNQLVKDAATNQKFVLILTDDTATLTLALSVATIVSISVGKAIKSVLPMIASICPTGSLDIIAMENNHALVKEVANELSLSGYLLHVLPAVIDRIASDMNTTDAGIRVVTEKRYELFVEHTLTIQNVFDGHKFVQLVNSARVLDFRHHQKAQLMNNIHWLVAVVRTHKIIHRVKTLAELQAQFLDGISDAKLDRELFELSAKLLSIRIMKQTSDLVLAEVFPGLVKELIFGSLFEYAKNTIKRTTKTQDCAFRVVGSSTKFAEKYATNFDDFMRDINKNLETYIAASYVKLPNEDQIRKKFENAEGLINQVRRRIGDLEAAT